MNAVGGILCRCVHSGLPLDWPSPPHCLLLLHGMLLQQRCLVYLHAACACIVTVEPAAAAAFLESDSCSQPVVFGILCVCN